MMMVMHKRRNFYDIAIFGKQLGRYIGSKLFLEKKTTFFLWIFIFSYKKVTYLFDKKDEHVVAE